MANILLLEPDTLLAGSYKSYLANANHKVYAHRDAQAALAQADKHTPDIVITQLQLAGRSGVEFLYEFRSYPDWLAIPVIMLGNLHQEDLDIYSGVFKELNISRYFYKPAIDLKHLLQAVEDCQLAIA